jgi:unspecific monooxygenase
MLLRHAPVRAQLVAQLELLTAFAEEVLRLHPPERTISRRAATDTEIAGVTIRAGAAVKLCLAAANRDPARFEQPSEPLLTRAVGPHLSFGAGIHHCLGAPLARLEMASVLQTLLSIAPDFKSIEPLETIRLAGFANDRGQLTIRR